MNPPRISLSQAAASLGRRGGSVKSAKKTAANRQNAIARWSKARRSKKNNRRKSLVSKP